MKTPLGTEVDLDPDHTMLDGDPALLRESRKWHSSPRLLSAHVYYGHGRPSQLLLSSCTNGRPKGYSLISFHASRLQDKHYERETHQEMR